jgi:hypothetical protein
LKRWLNTHPQAKPLGLAYSVPFIDPNVAGIEYTLPPSDPRGGIDASTDVDGLGPLPGWYALSVSEIQTPDGKYAYFERFRPVATAGYSIRIYRISWDEANHVRREMRLPELHGVIRGPADRTAKGS